MAQDDWEILPGDPPAQGGVADSPWEIMDAPPPAFDPEGADYDYDTAKRKGMAADQYGHWGSRVELSADEAAAAGVPPGSGIMLKGATHPTWREALQGERSAGFEVRRGRSGRYYSTPRRADPSTMAGLEPPEAAAQSQDDPPAPEAAAAEVAPRAVAPEGWEVLEPEPLGNEWRGYDPERRSMFGGPLPDQQDLGSAVLNEAIQAPVAVTGKALQGLAALPELRARQKYAKYVPEFSRWHEMPEVERQVVIQRINIDQGLSRVDKLYLKDVAERIAAGEQPPSERELFGTPGPETAMGRAGKTTTDWAEATFPVTPENKQRYAVQATSMITSMLPLLAAGAVSPPAALGLAGVMFGGAGAQDAIERAEQAGATKEQVARAADLGLLIGGPAGLVPLGVVMAPIARSSPGLFSWAVNKAANASRNGMVFASMGELQHFLTSQADKDFNPGSEYHADATRILAAMTAGGALGAIHPAGPVRADASTATRGARPAEQVGSFMRQSGLLADGTAAKPRVVRRPEDIDEVVNRIEHNPTEEQKASGQYPKAHIVLQGLPIRIENRRGSTRRGRAPDGTEWESEVPYHYGEIEGTRGVDGDPIDIAIGNNPASRRVFVIDQIDPNTGALDEHKAFVGYDTEQQARAAYDAGFSDGSGPQRRHAVTPMSMEEFRGWLDTHPTEAAAETVGRVGRQVEQDILAGFETRAREYLDRWGLGDIGLRVVQELKRGEGDQERNVNASYMRGLITVAIDRPKTFDRELFHEAIHAAEAVKLFTDAELAALERVSDAWRKAFDVDRRYAGMYDPATPEGQASLRQEARAIAASRYLDGQLQPKGIVGRALEKFKRLLDGIRYGFRQADMRSAEDVFRAMTAGEMRGRGRGREEPRGWQLDLRHRRPVNDTERFSVRDEDERATQGGGPEPGKPTAPAGATPGRVRGSGELRGSAELLADAYRSNPGHDLEGAPGPVTVPGHGKVQFRSFKPAQDAARTYMQRAGMPYEPLRTYAKVDVERAARIADEYARMRHDPTDPAVWAAYDQMIKETEAQMDAILGTGLKVEFIDYARQGDPYKSSPREAIMDVVNNNHLWVFSTRDGFGTDAAFDPSTNPLLRETRFNFGGKPALANDVFRVVHDYFGHIKDGVGFRADGEENAWRSHARMYSPLARRAMTSETRGQNSWLNYGPHGDKNRTAKSEDTVYADQKTGLMPEWVSREGADDPGGPRFSLRDDDPPSVRARLQGRDIKPTGGRGQMTVFDVAKSFDDEVRRRNRGEPLDPENPRHMRRAVEQAAREAEYQLGQPITGENWYSADVAKAFELSSRVVPELRENEDLRVLTTAVAAATSYNNTAPLNWQTAIRVIEGLVGRGKMPSTNPENGKLWSGSTGWNMKQQIELLQSIVDRKGLEGATDWLLSPHSVKEINAERVASGLYKAASKVPGRMDDQRMGAFILGEKGGAFMLNLNGIRETTADKWFTRTFNRQFGRSTGPGAVGDQGIVEAPRNETERSVMKDWNHRVGERIGRDDQTTQAVLWFFEQGLYDDLGVRGAKAESFADGAERLLKRRGIDPGAAGGRDARETARQPAGAAADIPLRAAAEPAKFSLRDDEPRPTFYSALTRAFSSIKQPRATPQHWRSIVQSLPGVKAEEVKWSGVLPWLEGRTEKQVSREDVQEFLRQNEVKVEEVVKQDSEESRRMYEEEGPRGEFDEPEPGETRWGVDSGYDVTLPGGKDYRELLLTLPAGEQRADYQRLRAEREAVAKSGTVGEVGKWLDEIDRQMEAIKEQAYRSSHWDEPNVLAHIRFDEREVPRYTRDDVNAIRAKLYDHGGASADPNSALVKRLVREGVISNEEWNTLLHERGKFSSDRADRVLFLQEIQSDWHQAGREHGYAEPGTDQVKQLQQIRLTPEQITRADRNLKEVERLDKEWAAAEEAERRGGGNMRAVFDRYEPPTAAAYDAAGRDATAVAREAGLPDNYRIDLTTDGWDVVRILPGSGGNTVASHRNLQNAILRGVDAINRDYRDEARLKRDARVPDAPFKTTWHELAFKRALRWAAEHGFDRLAWTTGDMQNERYNLSKHVDTLLYDHELNVLNGRRGADQRFTETVPPERLPEYIGRERAEALLAAPRNKYNMSELKVAEMELGGSGMRGFYDKMLPAFANKYGRQWGAKVEPIDIGDRYTVRELHNGLFGMFRHGERVDSGTQWGSREAAQRAVDQHNEVLRMGGDVHSLPITPEMRDSILNGQPMFSLRDNGRDAWRRVKAPMRAVAEKLQSTRAWQAFDEARDNFVGSVQMALAPMARAKGPLGDPARATAKNFINGLRDVQFRFDQLDRMITRLYPPARRAEMGRALDEQSVLEQDLRDATRDMGEAERTQVQDQARDEWAERGLGIARLSADERATVGLLNQLGQRTWERMQEAGVVNPEASGLPYYMPRMLIRLDPEGRASLLGRGARQDPQEADASGRGASSTGGNVEQGMGPQPMEPVGLNLTTAGPKRRKYREPEQTLAAARAKFGDNVELVTDIRTLVNALGRNERAITGRRLVDAIRDLGRRTGVETVSEEGGAGFFTIDHPALKQWRPIFQRQADGVVRPLLDPDGKPVMQRVPIHIAEELRGPLTAILSRPSPTWYRAAMNIKSTAMSMVMFSPMIHNMVEYGRAFPLMPGKMLTLQMYRDGYRFRQVYDRDGMVVPERMTEMREALAYGYTPIGQSWKSDLLGIVQDQSGMPGNSPMGAGARIAGTALFGARTGNAVARGIDAFEHFWHGTLLWERIADLQAGIYQNMRDLYLEKGMPRPAAVALAAHLANRYAGALPMESMSEWARRAANVAMFSRSFTLGNIGVMKDMINGLPRDVRAMAAEYLDSPQVRQALKSAARRKAIGAFVVDLALFYVGNSILQEVFKYFGAKGAATLLGGAVIGGVGGGMVAGPMGALAGMIAGGAAGYQAGKAVGIEDDPETKMSAEEILDGYLRRSQELMQHVKEHPVAAALNPYETFERLLPTWDNEPGKKARVFVGIDSEGRALYVRNPFGKIGEEFKDYMTHPAEIVGRKGSTLLVPLLQGARNDRGLGRPIYLEDHSIVEKGGRVVAHWMASQQSLYPMIEGTYDYAAGTPGGEIGMLKGFGPLFGVQVSRGAPPSAESTGPEAGVEYDWKRRQDERVKFYMEDVTKMVKRGKASEAYDILVDKVGMTPKEASTAIARIESGVKSAYTARQFRRKGDDESKSARENVRQ